MLRIWLMMLMVILALAACIHPTDKPLGGFTVVIDPGHGGTAETDSFRVGLAGEREEWVNLRVSLKLRDLLEDAGADVVLTRTEDVHVELANRARMAMEHQADVFISVHHNATADTSVNFPIVYFHGNASQNRSSVLLGRKVGDALRESLFDGAGPVSVVSDHTIFPTRGAGVLRGTYGIPAIISEGSFFTNPAEEQRLKQNQYNQLEARALFEAVSAFLLSERPESRIIEPYVALVEPLPVLQEVERMQPEALLWREDVQASRNPDDIEVALQRLLRSVRSFPDSYLAREAHHMRSVLYEAMGNTEAAAESHMRMKEFFPDKPLITDPMVTITLPEHIRLSVLIQTPDGNVVFEHASDRQVPSASVIKVQILAALLQAAADGIIDLNETYTLQDADIVGGEGDLQHGGAGKALKLIDYARLMIQTSDNTATNVIIRAVGMPAVNTLAGDVGLTQTVLAREMMDFGAIAEGRQNYTSAADMNRFLLAALNQEILNPQMRTLFWDILATCDDDTMLRAGSPSSVTVAHKTGILDYIRGDSGVLFGQQVYIISAFAEEFNDVTEAEKAIANVISQLY